jgi:hypothetical protein
MFHVKRSALAALALLVPSVAQAEPPPDPPSRPQANVGLVIGGAHVATDAGPSHTWINLGLRGDVLFGRNNPYAWGVGPMAGVGTYKLQDLSLQAGGSVLVPIQEYLPLVVSAGPYARKDGAWEPGAFASVFWGSRSFNYEGSYGLAAGILVEGRAGFGDARERTILIGAHLDLQALTLPVVMLINLFR